MGAKEQREREAAAAWAALLETVEPCDGNESLPEWAQAPDEEEEHSDGQDVGLLK